MTSESVVGNISDFFPSSSTSMSQTPPKITKDMLEEQVLKVFISGNLPFNLADNKHFQVLMSYISINNKPARSPGRTTLRTKLSQYSNLAVENLKNILSKNDSRVSLALDCWSSRSNYGFLGMYTSTFNLARTALARHILLRLTVAITCHWIDESWRLHDALLEFKHVAGHHYGEILGDEVFNVLEEYDITAKLFCIITDNAGNNGTMMKHISKRLKEDKNIDWDPEMHHIACLNHVINLAVQDFLKEIKGLGIADDNENELIMIEDDEKDENENIEEGFCGTMHKIRTITKVYFIFSH